MAVYPNGIKNWTNRINGVDNILAADINEAYAEIIAIETDLGAARGTFPNTATQLANIVQQENKNIGSNINILDINEAYAPTDKDLCILQNAYQTAVVMIGSSASSTGYVTITVTSTLVTGSPYTFNVNVNSGDNKPTIATAIANALNADINVNSNFTVLALSTGVNSGEVQIITKTQVNFDATLSLNIGIGTSGVATTVSMTCQPLVHPNILNIPGGWNGYRYWMVVTPLPYTSSLSGDSSYENPSIYASNNEITWIVPSGIINPVIPKPTTGYNSDPVLTLDLDGKTVWLTYRYTGGYDQLITASSNDGFKTMSLPTVLVTFNIPATERGVSPAILADYNNNQYVMWTVNFISSPVTLVRRTCSTMNGAWSTGSVCTITLPSGWYMWHPDIKKLGEIYYLLMQSSTINGGAVSSRFIFGSSSDGITWTMGNQVISAPSCNAVNGSLYKGSILPAITDKGIIFHLWYSELLENYYGYALKHTIITFDRTRRNFDYRNDLLSGVQLLYPTLFCDLFKTNGTLGVSTCGLPWTLELSTFNISNKYVSPSSATNTIAVYDVGVSDYFAQMKMGDITEQKWLLFRYVNTASFLRFGTSGSIYSLQQVGTPILNFGNQAINDVLGIKCKGDIISVYVNGELRGTITNSLNNTSTKFGIQAFTISAKIGEVFAKRLY